MFFRLFVIFLLVAGEWGLQNLFSVVNSYHDKTIASKHNRKETKMFVFCIIVDLQYYPQLQPMQGGGDGWSLSSEY
jgi:hypothetical protein